MSNGTITMTGAEYDALAGKIAALEAELVMRTNERNGLRVSLDTTVLQVEALQAELAKLRAGQEPVAAQVRFRRPEKGLADWSAWQQTTIKPNMPAWSIDSAGYEVEYRLLYTTPQPSAVPDVSVMARVLSDRAADACNIDRADNWAMYGQEYIDDVQAMLGVARLNKGAGSDERR